jgi:hypothetical protein
MNNTFTPRSMRSPLASASLFRKTKPKNWAYNKRSAGVSRDTATTIDIAPSEPLRTVCIKFNNKKNIFVFPNRLQIPKSSGFEFVKSAARAQRFDMIKLGGLKIKL